MYDVGHRLKTKFEYIIEHSYLVNSVAQAAEKIDIPKITEESRRMYVRID